MVGYRCNEQQACLNITEFGSSKTQVMTRSGSVRPQYKHCSWKYKKQIKQLSTTLAAAIFVITCDGPAKSELVLSLKKTPLMYDWTNQQPLREKKEGLSRARTGSHVMAPRRRATHIGCATFQDLCTWKYAV